MNIRGGAASSYSPSKMRYRIGKDKLKHADYPKNASKLTLIYLIKLSLYL